MTQPSVVSHKEAFPPEIAVRIGRIYRGVYLLSTLKRDEMLREGQQDELDRVHKEAHKSQDSIRREAAGSPKPTA